MEYINVNFGLRITIVNCPNLIITLTGSQSSEYGKFVTFKKNSRVFVIFVSVNIFIIKTTGNYTKHSLCEKCSPATLLVVLLLPCWFALLLILVFVHCPFPIVLLQFSILYHSFSEPYFPSKFIAKLNLVVVKQRQFNI